MQEPTPTRESLPFDWLEHGLIPILAAAFGVCGGLAALFFLQPVFFVRVFWWSIPWMLLLSTAAVYISQTSRMTRGPESLGLLLLAGSSLLSAAFASWSTTLEWSLPDMIPQVAPYTLVWILSAGSGAAAANITKLEDFIGDQGSSTLSWQQEPPQYTLGFFAARLLTLLLFAGVATGLAAAFGVQPHAGLTWSVAGLAFFGLVLQSASYLHRLRVIWEIQELDVHQMLARRWLQAALWVSGLLSLLILVLPANWLRIPWHRIGQWISDRMQHGQSLPPPAPPPAVPQPPQGPETIVEGDVHWLTALVYLVFFAATIAIVILPLLALIGFVLVYLLGEERAKLPGLLRLPVVIYQRLRSVWRRFRRSLGWAAKRAANVRSRWVDKPLHRSVGLAESAESQELLQMFLRLRQEALRQAADIRPGTTPRQVGWHLTQLAPASTEAIQSFIQHLHYARYSGHDLSPAQRRAVQGLYQHIMNTLTSPEIRGDHH